MKSLKNPNFSRLPSGYTEVEYIESSGTQYINTGITGYGSGTKVEFKVTNKSTGSRCAFGARESDGASSYINYFCIYPYYSTKFRILYGPSLGTVQTGVSSGTGTYVIEKDGRLNTINGDPITPSSSTETWSASTLSLYLFAMNSAGSTYQPYSGKVYYCKIWADGTLVRDFVPCINPDSEAGMYDLVSGTFFGNDGSGNFQAGNPV